VPPISLAGLIVSFYVFSVTLLVPRIRVAATILFAVSAQVVTSALIDQFGLLGMQVRTASSVRALGIARFGFRGRGRDRRVGLTVWPERHRAKNANQQHFGIKAHIGVEAESGVAHTVVAAAANVNNVTQAGALLHGDEISAQGDARYRGVHMREEAQGHSARLQLEHPALRHLLAHEVGERAHALRQVLAFEVAQPMPAQRAHMF
jgi:IS5 family transposase